MKPTVTSKNSPPRWESPASSNTPLPMPLRDASGIGHSTEPVDPCSYSTAAECRGSRHVQSLHGDPRRDANTNRFLKMCIIEPMFSVSTARRAAELRRRARAGSAVDALVDAIAEPGGTVLTGHRADIEALVTHAHRVALELV